VNDRSDAAASFYRVFEQNPLFSGRQFAVFAGLRTYLENDIGPNGDRIPTSDRGKVDISAP